jgi:hypothetical protein
MNDIMLNLITLAGFLVIGGIIFSFVMRHKKAQEEKLLSLCRQNHWNIEFIRERLARGFRITSPNWTIESISKSSGVDSGPASSDLEQTTTWFSSIPGDGLIIGPKLSKMNLSPLMKELVHQKLISDFGEGAENMQEISFGSEVFRNSFMVWTVNPQEIENMLTPALQSALLTWTKVPPLIKRNSTGTTIELKGIALQNPFEIESLVKLGEKHL